MAKKASGDNEETSTSSAKQSAEGNTDSLKGASSTPGTAITSGIGCGAAVALEDRTVSTDVDHGEYYGEDNDDDDDDLFTEENTELPLLNYSRLFSAGLPRKVVSDESKADHSMGDSSQSSYFEPSCACSKLTVIRIDPEDLVQTTSSGSINPMSTSSTTTDRTLSVSPLFQIQSVPQSTSQLIQQQQQLLTSDLWQQPHVIMACGWQGKNKITLTNVQKTAEPGTISLPVAIIGNSNTVNSNSATSNTDAGVTASAASASLELSVRDVQSNHSVVDMSFDSTGTVLGAIDEGGTCKIWEFKYTATLQPNRLLFQSAATAASSPQPSSVATRATTENTPGNNTNNNNVFTSWMSALTGMPSSHDTNKGGTSTSLNSTTLDGMTAVLTAQISSQPSRVNYPSNWGPPTCMVLDPSYKRKREKSLLVGFANGRLVLTKKGTFFQRRNDTILYQAGILAKDAKSQYRGIESVVWRGSLVAWADAKGIKLLDMEQLTRIAHIDRPTGARPSLYPTVRDLLPTLLFETSNHLLVAWGDCLMQMQIDEHNIVDQGTNRSSGTESSEIKKRRTVQCTMAWELDCVACDAVPMDANHIAVLGLVPVPEDGEGNDHNQDTKLNSHNNKTRKNDVELQVISRENGTVSFCDALPFLHNPSVAGGDSAQALRLLSTYAMPRMDNLEESKLLQSLRSNENEVGFVGIDMEFDLNQNLFTGQDNASRKQIEYRDPHLQWNLDLVLQMDMDRDAAALESNKDGAGDAPCRGINDDDTYSVDSDDYECILHPIETFEPWRGVGSEQRSPAPTMVICSASDAVLSLVSNIDDAVGNALARNKCALALKLAVRHRRQLRRYTLEDLANRYLEAVLRIHGSSKNIPSLSLRRSQLAVKAMPILLGDKVELWEKWAKHLETIPGLLFLLRNYIPVRDPVLPPALYGRVLERMLTELDQLTKREKADNAANAQQEGEKQYLESLVAWGPTKILKEYIQLYKYSRDRRKGDQEVNADLKRAEVALQRRYLQTAAGYLQFPVKDVSELYGPIAPRYDAEKPDSLFDVQEVMAFVARRKPLVVSPEKIGLGGTDCPNDHTSFEALARLHMMQGRYDLALKCFLAIGAYHATDSLKSFESKAVETVNGTYAGSDEPIRIGSFSYDFVMNLVERHHLNQYLLQSDFVLATDSKLFKPLLALLRLVGLRRLGDFLIEHCVSPDFSYNMTSSQTNSSKKLAHPSQNVLRREPLPLDIVAMQLDDSPALLHWYLHLVFTRRPEFYIRFPNNAVPPHAVTSLHRKHFQLYVDFAGELSNSSKALAGTEYYNADAVSTPLLSFIKAALPMGGLLPVDARRNLEIFRARSDEEDEGISDSASPFFALELAYVIENYSEQTEKEALGVLNLYLLGCKSLMLSVLFAQRQKLYSSSLWDRLITYCTGTSTDGEQFGELLACAAHAGADLARLVERIPPGMIVEGLRPRLVAAVADYRIKLEIYKAAFAAGSEEEISLLREIAHRSRRGVRYYFGKNRIKSAAELIQEKISQEQGAIGEKITEELPTKLPKDIKIKRRQNHYRLAYSISRR